MKGLIKFIIVLALGFAIGLWIASGTSAEVYDVGLNVYYDMESGTGTNLIDEVNGVVNGTLNKMTNANWRSPKLLSYGLAFDGSGASVNVTDNALLDLTSGSISIWVNRSSATDDMYVFNKGEGDDSTQNYALRYDSTSDGYLFAVKDGVGSKTVSGGKYANDVYQHVVVTWNASMITIYVNGTYKGQTAVGTTPTTNHANLSIGGQRDAVYGNNWVGTMDEMAIFSRVLNQTDVNDLYNGGSGLVYGASLTPSLAVELDQPADSSSLSAININFNATIVPQFTNITNATLWVWNSTSDTSGILFNNTETNIVTGEARNLTEWTISGFTIDSYHWNVYACGINFTSDSSCVWGVSNYSFAQGYTTTESFKTDLIEGEETTLEVNITGFVIDSGVTGTLIWNNTEYSSTKNVINSTFINFRRTITIPDETGTASGNNVPHYWDYTVGNSSTQNQTIRAISVGLCTGATTDLMLNLTLRDEASREFLNGTDYNTSIEIDLDLSSFTTGVIVEEYSAVYNQTNPAQVCLNTGIMNSTSLNLDATIKYVANERVTEYYHIQNSTITNNTAPQDIGLYDLLNTDSQEFLITFKGTDFVPVEDALIDITRYYVSEGYYRTVEIPKTDSNGQAISHLVLTDVIYTMVVSKNGEVLGIFENIQAFCDNQATGDCQISLNAFTGVDDFGDFDTTHNITYLFEFNKASRTVSVDFSTTDGSVKTMVLNSTMLDNFGNTTLCSNELTSSSGTLNCVIPDAFANVTFISSLYANGNFITSAIYSIKPSGEDIFGGTRVFIMIMMYAMLVFMFISSPIAIVFGGILAMILGTLLLLVDGGGFFGVGSVIMWFFIASAILIWQISKRGGKV